MWFENATVFNDQVSMPSRCNGNNAAQLPTLPHATQDWIDRTVGMPAPIVAAAPHLDKGSPAARADFVTSSRVDFVTSYSH